MDLRSNRSLVLSSFAADRVATGGGQVWVLVEPPENQPHGANLLRLDARSGRVRTRVRVPSNSLRTLAVGAGAVWVADDFTGGVWRVDPHQNSAPSIIAVDQGVDGVAATHDAVWTANSVAGTVAHIDPVSKRVVKRFAVGGVPRGIAIGAGRVWVTIVGAGQRSTAGGSLSPGARANGITQRNCGPVLAGPGGDPDLLIASDEPLEGSLRAASESANAAVAFVLRERGFRAGRFRLAMQACNDAVAQTGDADEQKCRANARAYAANKSMIGIVGPVHSFCTEAMLPVLNQAPGGPVSLVSTLNTHVRLVRRDPAAPADLLRSLYPTGQRGYARVSPSDDYEAAAGALFAKRLSPSGVFYVQDSFFVHDSWPVYFRTAAQRIGLRILGTVNRDEGARGEGRLAQRIRASGARAVYIQGINFTDIRRLRAALGSDVAVIVSSSAFPISRLFERFGQAARGVYMTMPGTPLARLGRAGQRFIRDFASTRPDRRVPAFAVYAAAATEVLLEAIAHSDGTRASVSRALSTTRVPDSPLGPIALDRNGELTRNPIAVLRADHGREPFDPQGTQGGVVIDVLTPAQRLVSP